MFRIHNRVIGDGQPCYVIAEMSANHGQSLEKALAIVRAAKDAGADAIKLQTYTPDTMTMDCNNEYFRIKDHPLWGGKNLYQLYQQAYTPWEWHKPLKDEATRVGLDFFSTPFDETAVDFLEDLGVPVYKVASFELVDDLLLKKIAHTRKPVIVSTGMASLLEIEHAVGVLRENGTSEIALLRCVSSYPADPLGMNLRLIEDMRYRFHVVAGLSDHTINSVTAVAAVALGANIIEKHFKLLAEDNTLDAAFSLSTTQFKNMVADIRVAEQSLGTAHYGAVKAEGAMKKYRRSLFLARDMKKGEKISRADLAIIRPGFGIMPYDLERVLGRMLVRDVERGQPLMWELVTE